MFLSNSANSHGGSIYLDSYRLNFIIISSLIYNSSAYWGKKLSILGSN